MNAIASWMDRGMKSLDETTLKAIKARIINDALGQPPGVALQDLPQGDAERGRLGYALLGLQSAFLRFQQIRVAANYYPWRGRIKRHDHLEMMAHLFLAEVYVYE